MATKTKQAPRADHYATITDTMLALFERGVKPWAKPWKSSGADALVTGLPFNVASGRNYRGTNVPMLWAAASAAGYSSHAWLTFKQAKDLGGHVKKGERGTMIVFWRVLEREEQNAEGETERSAFAMMRTATVFNIEQTEGVRIPKRSQSAKLVDAGGDLGPVGPVVERLNLDGGLHHGGNAAYYAPGRDSIQVPNASAFSSIEGYRATVLHECGHSTGHAKRLKREFGGTFGDSKYAAEELVAEMASAFVCAALGVRSDLELHASYLEHWQSLLRDDKRAFIKACSLAQAACDYMLPPAAESSDDADSDEAEDLKAAA